MSGLSRCEREQADIGKQIRAGDRGFGLRLGAQDWLKEESMMAALKTSSRKYPMPDKSLPHKSLPDKARAAQMVEKGKLSPASAARIRSKADRILGRD